MKKLLILGILILGMVVATDYELNYFHTSARNFQTSMSISIEPIVSAPTANVISGNPTDLRTTFVLDPLNPSGGIPTVCTGTTLTIAPRLTRSQWGTGPTTIFAPNPDCRRGSIIDPRNLCIPATPYSTPVSTTPIRWLTSSVYDTEFEFGNTSGATLSGYPGTSTIDRYNALRIFRNAPVSYTNASGTYNNLLGRANVFCKGTVTIDSGTETRTIPIIGNPDGSYTIAPTTINVNTLGTRTIRTTLNSVSCFAAVVNYPEGVFDNPPDYPGQMFRIIYYTAGGATPSTGTPIVGPTRTISVQNADPATIPPCSLNSGTPVRVATLGSRTLVRVAVSNDGTSPIDLSSSLTSSNSQYTVRPMQISPTNECDDMARAYSAAGQAVDFVCPVENGFERALGARTSRQVYLTVDRVGAGGGTLVSRLSAQGSAVCGTRPNCNRDITLTGIVPGTGESRINCQVYTTAPGSPNFVTIGPGEIATVGVQCTNSTTGAVVDCPTNNWQLNRSGGGNLGTIIDSNNRNARFTVDSVGPTGQIIYNTGTSTCAAPISTMSPQYRCAFNPPSATMVTLESRDFALSCTNNGVTIPPSSIRDARYSAQNGLIGSASGLGVNNAEGARFVAGSSASSGNLVGDISINPDTIRPYITGIRPVAPITVNLDDTTTATSCAITPSTLTIGTLELGQLNVQCRNRLGAIVPCVGSDWRLNGISGGFEVGQSSASGTVFYTTSSAGSTGSVEYRYAGRSDVSCTSTINVVTPIFSCTLNPPSATMNTADVQRFALNCLENRGTPTPRIPENARYSQSTGLFGIISAESTSGASFTAGMPSSGLFFGAGLFSDSTRPSVIGAIAQAPVTIRSSGPEVTCTMNPGIMQLGEREVATATLLCTNRLGAIVPCSGNFNFNGVSGTIIPGRVPSPNQFSFFINNGPGVMGSLEYRVDGDATNSCAIQITTIDPRYRCSLIPDSLRVGVGNTSGLDLSCSDSGVIRLPDKAEYYKDPSLFITFSNPRLTGVNLTGDARSSGYGYGIGVFSDASRPYLTGAVGISKIAVDDDGGCSCPLPTSVCADGTTPRCTLSCSLSCNEDDGDGNNRRRNEFCMINNGAPLEVYPMSNSYVEVVCGSGNPRVPGYNECNVLVEWRSEGARLENQTSSGAILIPTAGIGTSGRVIANVTVGTRRGGCESDFVVQNPSCLRVS